MKRWLIAAALPLAACLEFHRGALPDVPADRTRLDVGGVHLRYADRGEGRAVVLLHGFASSLESWDPVLPALAGYRTIAPDLKGFGLSDRPEGDYSPQEQARLVLALMDARGVERAAFVAHSWGVSVALAAALVAPQRVTRLALYDAWVYEDQIPAFFRWSRTRGVGEALFWLFYDQRPDDRMSLAFYDPRVVPEAVMEGVERQLARPGTIAAALAATRGQRFSEWQERYREVRQPALLLWGREDAVSRVDVGERLARDLPDARLVVYPRCGHFPMIEATAASNRDLVAFLAGRSR